MRCFLDETIFSGYVSSYMYERECLHDAQQLTTGVVETCLALVVYWFKKQCIAWHGVQSHGPSPQEKITQKRFLPNN